MRGIPTYTQHTVAFPTVSLHDGSAIEEVNVSFNAKGGGTHGEFCFRWYDFGKNYPGDTRDRKALRVEAFTDGMAAMLDWRILPILHWLASRRRDAPEVTPERLIEMLKDYGIRPSTYQLRGLYQGTHGSVSFWPEKAQSQHKALIKHERGE